VLAGGTSVPPPGVTVDADATYDLLAGSRNGAVASIPTSLSWQTQVPSDPPMP